MLLVPDDVKTMYIYISPEEMKPEQNPGETLDFAIVGETRQDDGSHKLKMRRETLKELSLGLVMNNSDTFNLITRAVAEL